MFEGGHSVVVICGGVATRKTTLAEHLARQFPEKYVNVPFTGEGKKPCWVMGIVEAVEQRTLAAEKNLTLVYDEVHTLLSIASAMHRALQGQ